jgi:hypothetical protein
MAGAGRVANRDKAMSRGKVVSHSRVASGGSVASRAKLQASSGLPADFRPRGGACLGKISGFSGNGSDLHPAPGAPVSDSLLTTRIRIPGRGGAPGSLEADWRVADLPNDLDVWPHTLPGTKILSQLCGYWQLSVQLEGRDVAHVLAMILTLPTWPP